MLQKYLKALVLKCESKRSLVLKATQMLALYVFKRNGPGYFMQARFWRKGVEFRCMLQHHNESEYKSAVNAMNDVAFQKLSQHKLAEKGLLSMRGLPSPRLLGFFHRERGGDILGRALRTEADLAEFLSGHLHQRICFKKAEGSGGSAFSAMDVKELGGKLAMLNPATGESVSVSTLCNRLSQFKSGSIIEEYLVQHPRMDELNPDSVNTLRIMTMRTASGFKAHGAMLRIGRKGSQVDNTTNGGLACPLDLISGRVIEALDLSVDRRTYERHPDSNKVILGFEVPHWKACLDLACDALAAIPRMNFAGVDIAVTEQGPSVIELNVIPDRRFATHLDLPHRRLFAQFSRADFH